MTQEAPKYDLPPKELVNSHKEDQTTGFFRTRIGCIGALVIGLGIMGFGVYEGSRVIGSSISANREYMTSSQLKGTRVDYDRGRVSLTLTQYSDNDIFIQASEQGSIDYSDANTQDLFQAIDRACRSTSSPIMAYPSGSGGRPAAVFVHTTVSNCLNVMNRTS